jgi:hypothetical protein
MVPVDTAHVYDGVGDTAATLKFTNPPLHHDPGLAVSAAGVAGLPVTAHVLAGPLKVGVHAVVLPTTEIVPLANEEPTVNNMVVVPCPLAIVVPAGTVQV